MNENAKKVHRHAWLFSSRLENWEQIVRQKSFGTRKPYPPLNEAQPGDPCIGYVPQRKLFVGLGKITGSPYPDKDSPFPNRIPLEMRVNLQRVVPLRTIRARLQFTKDKAVWLAVRNGVAHLPYADYEVVGSALELLFKDENLVTFDKEVAEPKEQTIEIDSPHTLRQYLLLKLGSMLGCKTYVAANDGSKICRGERLLDRATLKELPPFSSQEVINTARSVDVIWFDLDNYPIFCFEVEHTTPMSQALVRLNQLVKSTHAHFVIVAPAEKEEVFLKEIEKLAFRQNKNRFNFISYEKLEKYVETVDTFISQSKELFGEPFSVTIK